MVVLNDDGEVRAAGGVLCRTGDDGLEVLVVHRPRYRDWTLPKGKVEEGESDEECARREVEEETGLRCEIGDELPSIRYHDRHRRPKVVRYWRMTVIGGAFEPADEVDAIEWLSPPDAIGRLTYPRDAEVLRALVEAERAAS